MYQPRAMAQPSLYPHHGFEQAYDQADTVPEESGGIGLAIGFWGPGLMIAALLVLVEQRIAGLIVIGVVACIHALLRPQVAVYALLVTIPLEWMVRVLPTVMSITKLVGIFALLFTIPKLYRSMSPARWDPSFKWMLMLILWAGVSLVWSPVFASSLLAYSTLCLVWGMALMVGLQLNTRRKLLTGLMLYTGSCLLSIGFFLATGDISDLTGKEQGRHVFESFVGTHTSEAGQFNNTLSRVYAVGLFASVYFLLTSEKGLWRLCCIAVLAALCLGVILSKSRAAYLFVPMAIMGATSFLKGEGAAKRIIATVVVGILVGGLGYATVTVGLFGRGIQKRASTMFDKGLEEGNRLRYWQAYSMAFLNSAMVGKAYYAMHDSPESNYHRAHNDWFSIAGELGLPGLFLFAMFHLSLYRRMRLMHEPWAKMFCLSVWLFILLAGMTQDDYCYRHYTLSVAFVVTMLRQDEAKAALVPLAYAGEQPDEWQLASARNY